MAVSDSTAVPIPVKKLGPREAIQAILWCPDGKNDDGSWRWAAPIDGKTRLVKELFLVEQETRSGAGGALAFKFTPGQYGPSSLELTNCLNSLIQLGEVTTSPLASGRGVTLRLGPELGRAARNEWAHLTDQLRADLYRVKSKVAPMTYKQFIVYVYRTYPDFLENSLIRDEVLAEDAE